tara:strand:- start:11639 stop:11812 length:174 start_codon:yes stop_codon:yes gene_type:complete
MGTCRPAPSLEIEIAAKSGWEAPKPSFQAWRIRLHSRPLEIHISIGGIAQLVRAAES